VPGSKRVRLIASKQPMAIPDREKWSAVLAFSFATFIVLLGTLILLSAVFAPQAQLVALFGAWMLSAGAAWLCDGLFAIRLYTRDPRLWDELGRPEVNQPWGPERYRKLHFKFLPASRYPRGLWVHHQLCRLLHLVWIGLLAALAVVCFTASKSDR
jgi:hypothetical protein